MAEIKNSAISEPSRMNIRLAVEIKERIIKAAVLSGQDLTEFAISTLSEKADEIIERHDNLLLGSEDYQFFLNSLTEDAPEPSAKSKMVADKYKKGIRKGVKYQLAD